MEPQQSYTWKTHQAEHNDVVHVVKAISCGVISCYKKRSIRERERERKEEGNPALTLFRKIVVRMCHNRIVIKYPVFCSIL